jgi:hypothetical protein
VIGVLIIQRLHAEITLRHSNGSQLLSAGTPPSHSSNQCKTGVISTASHGGVPMNAEFFLAVISAQTFL